MGEWNKLNCVIVTELCAFDIDLLKKDMSLLSDLNIK